MFKKCFHLLLAVTILFYNCSDRKYDSQYYISRFYKHQSDFDKLMIELRSNELLQKRNSLKIFKSADFDKETKNNLNRLGITEIIFYPIYCDSVGYGNLEFDLTTDWSKQFPVHLNQTLCDNEDTIKRSYVKRKNTNEGWGLGDKWILWFEHSSVRGGLVQYYDKKTDTATQKK